MLLPKIESRWAPVIAPLRRCEAAPRGNLQAMVESGAKPSADPATCYFHAATAVFRGLGSGVLNECLPQENQTHGKGWENGHWIIRAPPPMMKPGRGMRWNSSRRFWAARDRARFGPPSKSIRTAPRAAKLRSRLTMSSPNGPDPGWMSSTPSKGGARCSVARNTGWPSPGAQTLRCRSKVAWASITTRQSFRWLAQGIGQESRSRGSWVAAWDRPMTMASAPRRSADRASPSTSSREDGARCSGTKAGPGPPGRTGTARPAAGGRCRAR